MHNGHLLLAENARVAFNLDRVIFVPAGLPPHKPKKGVADNSHRLKMLKLAVFPNKYFSIGEYEIKKNTPSYTYDTIEHFKKIYPAPKHKIYFIAGDDVLSQIKTWKYGEKILERCDFIVGIRTPCGVRAAGAVAAKPVAVRTRRNVRVFAMPYLNVSSTFIRSEIRKNKSVLYLLPDSVIEYIRKNGLYI